MNHSNTVYASLISSQHAKHTMGHQKIYVVLHFPKHNMCQYRVIRLQLNIVKCFLLN